MPLPQPSKKKHSKRIISICLSLCNVVFNIRFFAHISFHFHKLRALITVDLFYLFIHLFMFSFVFLFVFFVFSFSLCLLLLFCRCCLYLVFSCSFPLLFLVWFILNNGNKMFRISHFHCVLHVSFHTPVYFGTRMQSMLVMMTILMSISSLTEIVVFAAV